MEPSWSTLHYIFVKEEVDMMVSKHKNLIQLLINLQLKLFLFIAEKFKTNWY